MGEVKTADFIEKTFGNAYWYDIEGDVKLIVAKYEY